MWHVYILRCSDGSLYVGHAQDLELRFAQHCAGEGGDYTRERLPVRLVHSTECATRLEAFQLERRLKGWSRPKKEALIAGDWNEVRRLAAGPEMRRKRSASSR